VGRIQGVGVDCRLHPLIHTPLGFTLAQDVGFSQRLADWGMAPRIRDFTTAEAKTKTFSGVEWLQLLKA